MKPPAEPSHLTTLTPKSTDRTYEELDILFANNVAARKFATTNPHIFDDRHPPSSGTSKVLHDHDGGDDDIGDGKESIELAQRSHDRDPDDGDAENVPLVSSHDTANEDFGDFAGPISR